MGWFWKTCRSLLSLYTVKRNGRKSGASAMWSNPASASTRSTQKQSSQNSQKRRCRYFARLQLYQLHKFKKALYSQTVVTYLVQNMLKYFQVLDLSDREFFDGMGVYFVRFVGQYGYDRVLSVLGRHMRDFLNGCDPIKCKNGAKIKKLQDSTIFTNIWSFHILEWELPHSSAKTKPAREWQYTTGAKEEALFTIQWVKFERLKIHIFHFSTNFDLKK